MPKKIDVSGLDHYHDKVSAMLASEYSSSKTYAVGDYCFHAGTLYECTTAITTAENWTAGHWTAAKLAEDTSALKTQTNHYIFDGKIVLNKWYQGARSAGSSMDIITTNANRCTSDTFRLEKGYSYKISGIPSGYKVVLAGTYDGGGNYDGGWKTTDIYGLLSNTSGKFFVNVATQSGNTALTPSNISSIYIEITGESFDFPTTERTTEIDDRFSSIHNLINYDYLYRAELHGTAGATGSTAFNVYQNGTELTITDMNYPNGISKEAYVRLNGLARDSGTSYPLTKIGNFLKANRTYLLTLEALSGTIVPSGYVPSVSVYRTGSTTSVGNLWRAGNKSFREFTTVADLTSTYYDLAFYIPSGTSFNNAKFRIILEDVTDDNGVFTSEINTTIQTVRSLQTEPSIVFPLVTDLHYGFSQSGDNFLFEHHTIKNIEAVTSQVRSDFVVCLGDITHGNTANTKNYAEKVNSLFRNLGIPYLLAIGNHDDNRYGTTFSESDMYAYYSAFADNRVVFNEDTNGRDYYIDMPNYKTRFIVLDSNTIGEFGFPQDCVDWFTGTALETPDDYLAVVFTHISPIATQNYNDTEVDNGDDIADAITAYQTGGKPIVQFYGHSHVDVDFDSPYLSIATNCEKFENTNGDSSLWPEGAIKPARVMGEASEDCWDMVVIRPLSRKIDCVRFGAGSDRSFTY